MEKIKKIHSNHLRNEAHYEFLRTFKQLVDESPEVSALVATPYDAFVDLLDKEKGLLDLSRASLLTWPLAKADRRVDHAISAIKATVAAARLSLDASVARAAERLRARVREFGDIRRKPYSEETAAVQVLVDELTGAFAAEVQAVGLTGWLAELVAASAEFTRIFMERGHERAVRPAGRMKEARREIDGVYREMVTIVEASEVIAPTRASSTFISDLNVRVAYFTVHDHHHARKDIGVGGRCVVERIGTLPYTGKAVTPIPAVYYREEEKPEVELVFTKDFFVTYRCNVDEGMANLAVRGKGGYKGRKMTTFNIARKEDAGGEARENDVARGEGATRERIT